MRDDRGDGYKRAFWPTVSCSKYKAVEVTPNWGQMYCIHSLATPVDGGDLDT